MLTNTIGKQTNMLKLIELITLENETVIKKYQCLLINLSTKELIHDKFGI